MDSAAVFGIVIIVLLLSVLVFFRNSNEVKQRTKTETRAPPPPIDYASLLKLDDEEVHMPYAAADPNRTVGEVVDQSDDFSSPTQPPSRVPVERG